MSGDKVRFLFLLFVTPCELILTARSVLCCSYLPGDNLSFCGSHFLPNYGRQHPWSRIRVLLIFMMFFNAGIWSASTCSFVPFYLFIYSSTRTLEHPSYKISYHDAQEVESGFGGGNKNYQGVYLMSFFHPKGSYIRYKPPKLDFFLSCSFGHCMTKKNNFGVCHGPWTHGTTRSPQEEELTHIDLDGQ